MSKAATIAKGSFWSLLSGMLTKLISFIYTIIIARFLLQEEIGIFYLVLSVLGILYLFTDLGLIHALGRYVPYFYGRKEFGKLKDLVKMSYLGGAGLTFIFSVLVFFLSGIISNMLNQPLMTPILQIMAIWLLIKEIDDVNRGVLQGRTKMKESQGLNVVQNIIKLVLTLVAFYVFGFNATALSVAFLFSFLLILPLGFYYALKEIRCWKQDDYKQTTNDRISLGKEIIAFGLVMSFLAALWTVIEYTDKIMLGYFIGVESVAIYSIALGLASLVLIFPTAITGIFFPVVSELFGEKNIDAMNKTLGLSMKWLIFSTIPLTLMMVVFGQEFLKLFYGADYESGAIVLVLFVIGLFIRSIFSLPQLILAVVRRLDIELIVVSIAAITNFLLNLFFIPLWGVNGAAGASLISFIVMAIMTFYYSRQIYGFSFPKELYKPLIAGVIGFIILFFLKDYILFIFDNHIIQLQVGQSQGQLADELLQKAIKLCLFCILFILSCVVYFFVLLGFKSFKEDEIGLLNSALMRIGIPEAYRKLARTILEAKYLPF